MIAYIPTGSLTFRQPYRLERSHVENMVRSVLNGLSVISYDVSRRADMGYTWQVAIRASNFHGVEFMWGWQFQEDLTSVGSDAIVDILSRGRDSILDKLRTI